MAQQRDWRDMMAWSGELLERRTGDGVAVWNQRVADSGIADEPALRRWLAEQGITGYPQMVLVYERFGYPEFLLATADELLDAQYEGRPGLREIAERVIELAQLAGPDVAIQLRKTYVSLVGPRRTFSQIAPLKTRVDVGLRIDLPVGGRLLDGRNLGNRNCPVKIPLATLEEVDDEVAELLSRAYEANL